ncbi:MAG: DUF1761 domain-containing protein [Patescibacteria group bacterium]|jgi:hypothetical protein
MFETSVNWLAVLVTGLGYMVIGGLWYGPLFQKPWMRLANVSEADAKAGAGKAYVMMFIVALVSVFVLAMFVNAIGADTFDEGMLVGLLIWVGFVGTVLLNGVIFEKRPFALYVLNSGYNLVTLLVAGGVLAIWS